MAGTSVGWTAQRAMTQPLLSPMRHLEVRGRARERAQLRPRHSAHGTMHVMCAVSREGFLESVLWLLLVKGLASGVVLMLAVQAHEFGAVGGGEQEA
jgi:hypothetical protein